MMVIYRRCELDSRQLKTVADRKSSLNTLIAIVQFTPPRQTRHRQDCLVLSCLAGGVNRAYLTATLDSSHDNFPSINACAISFIVGKIAEASVPRASRKNKFHHRGISAAPISIPAIFLLLLSSFPRISRNWAVRSPPGRGGWSTSWLTVDRPSSSAVRRRRPRSSSSSWRGPAVCGRSRGQQACGTRG